MIKNSLRGLSKSFGSQVDPEKSVELRRTKTDIEHNLSRVIKLLKNEDQSKKEGNPRKAKELVGLIEDFYNKYQSLYALHGEYAKASPCRFERVPSRSSSSSESDYFSSEEIDGYTEVNNVHQDHLTTQAKGLRKRNLEPLVESQARKIEQLGAKNTELRARVLELALLLKDSKGTVSVLLTKHKNNEDQATCKVTELMVRINKLEQEAKTLRTQKGKMEEKIKRNRNDLLSQKKDFTDQLNVMQQQLDSVSNKNKELETHLEREGKKVSQYLVWIENLEENLSETTAVKKSLKKEEDCFLARIKDLELEVESRCNTQNDLEEQFRDTRSETNQIVEEGKALQNQNHELERAMAQKEEEISALLREHESVKREASIQVMSLKAELDNLRLELDTLQDQKNKLELHNERSQKEYSDSLAKIDDMNIMLETQMADKEETIKNLEETIAQIGAETKQAKQDAKMLEEKIASYEDELRTMRWTPSQIEVHLNGIELIAQNELDLAAGKLEEHRKCVLGLVSKMLGEVQFAKDWIREKNGEMKQLKDTVDHLTVLLGDKEEQEMLLREKVWKLEATISKEGGEKLNLLKAVSQLERKVRRLEKNLKEKDEELVSLGDKKKEAIRQLCFLTDFHRNRSAHLLDLMSKLRRKVNNNKPV